MKFDWGSEYRLNKYVSLFFQGRNILNDDTTSMETPAGNVEGQAAAMRVYDIYGASAPFGMIQRGPDTAGSPTDTFRGSYDHRSTYIRSFSLTHFHGAGSSWRHDITLMPAVGSLDVSPVGRPAADTRLNGLDLLPLLRNPDAQLERDAVFFHHPHYYETTTPVSAVRARDWKLLEYFEDNRVELCSLKDDPIENTDLARQQPAKADELRERLHAWREAVGAALPKTNPDFKGKKR